MRKKIIILLLLFIFVNSFVLLQNYDKIPLFIGIFAKDNNTTFIDMFKFLQMNFEKLLIDYPQEHLSSDLALLLQNKPPNSFKFPLNWHITTLYLGNNGSKKESPYYKNFTDNLLVPIHLQSLIYIPGKIICAPMFRDNIPVLIENEFPHLTIFLGKWNAVNCNCVLEGHFGEGKVLRKEYQLFKNKNFEISRKYDNIKICNETVQSFVIKKADLDIILEGITDKYYINNNYKKK